MKIPPKNRNVTKGFLDVAFILLGIAFFHCYRPYLRNDGRELLLLKKRLDPRPFPATYLTNLMSCFVEHSLQRRFAWPDSSPGWPTSYALAIPRLQCGLSVTARTRYSNILVQHVHPSTKVMNGAISSLMSLAVTSEPNDAYRLQTRGKWISPDQSKVPTNANCLVFSPALASHFRLIGFDFILSYAHIFDFFASYCTYAGINAQ